MDEVKRKTLRLMEQAVRGLAPAEQQLELLRIAADYVTDGALNEARVVMTRLDVDFIRHDLVVAAERDDRLLRALILLVETFGADLAVFTRPGGAS
jgi:predicted secreted Zn-dependent protease